MHLYLNVSFLTLSIQYNGSLYEAMLDYYLLDYYLLDYYLELLMMKLWRCLNMS